MKFSSIGSVTVLLQPSKVDHFTAKYFNGLSYFSYNSYFLCTPLHGLAICSLTYSVYLLFSYLNHALLDFSETATTFTLCIFHYTVEQFSDLSCYLINIIFIPEHTLHSRVKDSITHNSTVILSSNFNGRLVY